MGMSAQDLNTLILFLTFVGLLWYALETRRIRLATQNSARIQTETLVQIRDSQAREAAPYVVAYFEIPEGRWVVFLVIENLGKTPARNIRLKCDPELKNRMNPRDGVAFVDLPLSYLAPRQSVRTAVAITTREFNDADFPMKYDISVEWEAVETPYESRSEGTHDLSAYLKMVPCNKDPLEGATKALKDIANAARDYRLDQRREKEEGKSYKRIRRKGNGKWVFVEREM